MIREKCTVIYIDEDITNFITRLRSALLTSEPRKNDHNARHTQYIFIAHDNLNRGARTEKDQDNAGGSSPFSTASLCSSNFMRSMPEMKPLEILFSVAWRSINVFANSAEALGLCSDKRGKACQKSGLHL